MLQLGRKQCRLACTSTLGRRFRHHKPHRVISVQLLTTIEGLGQAGTVHKVNPGYMRNTLFPLQKARYLEEGPALSHQLKEPIPYVDINRLAEAMRKLPEVTLERRAPESLIPGRSESVLYRPIMMQTIADHLREAHDIQHLFPPNALLRVKGRPQAEDRLTMTGDHVVEAHLSGGAIIPVHVRVQRKLRSTNEGR